jgi:hypothetical protein
MSTDLVNFTEAKAICEVETAQYMVSIHDKEEEEFVVNHIFVSNKIHDAVWIGLQREKKDWVWNDNSGSVKEFFWAPLNPENDTDKGFDCVELVEKSDSPLRWDDQHCDKRNLVFCQKDPQLKSKYLREFLKNISEYRSECFKNKLKNISIKVKEFSNDIFKDKFIYFKSFIEDNKDKAFMIPIVENRKYVTFEEADKTCARFNSTLVEITTWEKQMALNSFLYQMNEFFEGFFWLNAMKVSDKQYKWKQSNTDVGYLNWHPDSREGQGDLIAAYTNKNENFGKWMLKRDSIGTRVVCEYTLNF